MAETSLTNRAYKEIRDWITHYRLKPGVQIKIDELSATLGMSTTPIREALSRLEQEHFVDHHPQKGYLVRALDLKDVSDMYDLRMALEVVAAEEAATRMTKADRHKLSQILDEVGNLVKKGERGRLLSLEQNFHVIITEATGNWLLKEILRGVLDRIWMIQNLNLLTSDHLVYAHKEHAEIYQALKRGEPQKAAALMKKHLEFAKKYILSRLQDSRDVLAHLITGLPGLPSYPEDLRPKKIAVFGSLRSRGKKVSPKG